MAQCNTCRKPLPKGAQFCGFCGTKVLDRCPKCGNTDLPGPNYCIRCGTSLRDGLAGAPSGGQGQAGAAPPSDAAIEAELQFYKASFEEGHQIITCAQCGAKNRIQVSKLGLNPACGRCKAPLPSS